MNAPRSPKPSAKPGSSKTPAASALDGVQGRLTPVAPAARDPGKADDAPKPPAKPRGKPPARPKAEGGKPPAQKQPAGPKAKAPPPPAPRSRLKRRHFMIMISFVLIVIAPSAFTGWYLWTRAADQYASRLGFSVRTEEAGSSIASILGPLDLSSSSSSDTSILYEFIQSQDLVARIDADLDLRRLWSKANPEIDPVFSFHPPGTIEDLVEYWSQMVKIFLDGGSGLIELEVRAFAAEDAQRIGERIFAESSALINELSAIAREDAIGYARDELDVAVERLKAARSALTQFRNRTQIVDPSIDLQGQAGLLNTLNQQLAEALIELDLLRETTRESDPRIAQAERRIRVIEQRIAEERKKLGIGGGAVSEDAEAFAVLVGEYERILVDREFAEEAYKAALATFDAAQAEARRQSRYLAAHVRPTLAEKSVYPKRIMLLLATGFFLFVIWAILVLVAYAIKDRR